MRLHVTAPPDSSRRIARNGVAVYSKPNRTELPLSIARGNNCSGKENHHLRFLDLLIAPICALIH